MLQPTWSPFFPITPGPWMGKQTNNHHHHHHHHPHHHQLVVMVKP